MNASVSLVDYAVLVAHVNGTVDEQDRHRIEKGLQERADLRDEYRYLLKLRRALQQPLTPAPGDFGLDRLKQSIEEIEAGERRENWKVRLRNLLLRLFGPT